MEEPDLRDIESPSSNAEYLHFDGQDEKKVDEMEVGGHCGVDCGICHTACSSLELLPASSMPVSLGTAMLLPVGNTWLAMALKDCCDARNA